MERTKSHFWITRLVALFVTLSPCHLVTLSSAEAEDRDVKALKSAGIPTDGPGLASYFKRRTSTISDESRIKELVQRLGSDEFKVREEASRQLVMLGPRARPFLQVALKNSDPEIVRRAQDCLERIARGATSSSLCAAVRVLARCSPPNAGAVLLDYLPSVEDERVIETIHQVLPSVAVRDGKAEPALVEALTDKSPVKRAAAAAALCQARLPDVLPKVRKLLHDGDAQVRLRVGLALAAHGEKDAVSVLIRLLDELPWRDTDPIMNLLEHLAGENMPPVVYGPDAESHRKYRQAWESWWKEQQAKVDPARLEQALRLRGFTMVVLLDEGVIEDLNAANQVNWKIDNIAMPLDAQLLPGEERVLVAEHRLNRVSERNLKGEILWKRMVAGPLMAQRLPNGNTFIATRSMLFEIDKNGKEVFSYSRHDGAEFMRAVKLRDGDIACLVSFGGALVRYVRLRPAGKDFNEDKSWGVQVRTSGGRVEVLPNGHVLIPEMDNNRVVEYDADGQSVWEVAIEQPIAAVRLANGNTIVTLWGNRAIEVDRAGKQVWQFKTDKDGSRVTRAFRR
ncbi:MAG TPA: HEAT repeat domain-containing protein [Gemmataceae bacterium]|nr:HEAT repeat domain-containing protein [Gemmataceae bacterium]